MITESEARAKRCCGPEGCGDRLADDNIRDRERYCIASDCMAWEWISGKWEGDDLKARTPEEGKAEYVKRGECGLKRK